MTGVNKMISEPAMVGAKDLSVKTKKTDVFQSVMNLAQNISSQTKKASTEKSQTEDMVGEPSAKDIITSKLNLANHQIKAKDTLNDLDSQAEEIMGQLMVAIKQEIINLLGVTEEELAIAMESLGIEDVDLLSGSNLTDLVVHMATGEEESLELLFHPEFAETLKELQGSVKALQTQVLKELNLTEKEFHTLVEQMVNDMANSDESFQVENDLPNPKATEQKVESNGLSEVSQSVEVVDAIITEGSAQKSLENGENLPKGNENQAINLAATTNTNVVSNLEAVLETLTDEVEATSIIKQIVDEVQVSMKQGISSMELQLNPEHLGKIHLEVVAKNGVITASIAAETQMAKEAIESQMLVLKENLLNQGVKVEEVEVTIATHQFEQNLDSHKEKEEETNSSKRRLNLNGLDLEDENLNSQDMLEQSIMLANGNSVNLTA